MDADAFDTVALMERPRLLGLAYRMLGSYSDAEDIVQDALLRFHAVHANEIVSPAAYLTTVTTRLAIDHLRSARVRRESYVGPWLPEPIVADPAPDAAAKALIADSLSIAFLVLLERLSPTERAVLVLHDVFASHRSRAVLKCRNLSRDGRLVWCEWHTSLVLDSYGVPASALALVLDVTDRISAEHALLWGETRLRQVLRGAGMLGWDWDFAARRVFATADLGDYFGLPRDRDYTVGDAAWLPIHPDDRPAVRAAMDHSARTGSDFKFEFRGAVADGASSSTHCCAVVIPPLSTNSSAGKSVRNRATTS